MRVSTFDELNGVFEGNVVGWCQEKMDVFGHYDECMELKSPFPPVTVESLQEEPDVILDDEETPPLPSRERYEIRSGWGDESARLQGRTSAAQAAIFA